MADKIINKIINVNNLIEKFENFIENDLLGEIDIETQDMEMFSDILFLLNEMKLEDEDGK